MADSKKYDGSQWEHSLRKLTTATDTLTTLPIDLYADGNNATVGLKGNMSQTGTPTPQNPIQPQETGERTGNLFDKNDVLQGYRIGGDGLPFNDDGCALSDYIEVTPNTIVNQNYSFGFNNCMAEYDENKTFIIRYTSGNGKITTSASTKYIRVAVVKTRLDETMVTMGATTPSSYEPYGYKIPISSANTTTNIYLGETQTTRRIGKIDLSEVSWAKLASGLWRTQDIPNVKYVSANTELGDGIAEKYTIHTGAGMISALNCIAIDVSQISVNTGSGTETPTGMFWYALATEETAVVNEPLMKIGDYADEVSGITIPTITGKDTFDVQTTLKPSEVELTYTGWHDAEVKEWDGTDWQ